ncbi:MULTISPECIES: glucan biosynthesis protein G [unclassified Zymobacter]|uniref:glucan biosynthesis protein G n=1 Tax=unclassified Zymobacter TaxID=3048685 RepID=UPI0039C3E598
MPDRNFSKHHARRWMRMLSVLSCGIAGMAVLQASAFDFNDVSSQAQSLAQERYDAPAHSLSSSLSALDYAHYRDIHFKNEYALWHGQGLPFELGFYPEGMVYDTPVEVNEVAGDQVHALTYAPEQFDWSANASLKPEELASLGYAGFEVRYGLGDGQRHPVMAFLGASYFRAIGENQHFGVTGRSVAIDTGLSSGEQMPQFKRFWVVKPSPGDRYLIIYALLDSPSVTGAYRFVLRPGEDSIVDVQSRLFMRDKVNKLGIAPLASMFYYGSAQPSNRDNFRPAMHTSDGLLVRDDKDDWTWQPLLNPRRLNINDYEMQRLAGFGLMQRDHDFSHYQDVDERYDQRPSVWVEPTQNWGAGKVQLIQIPSPDETNDNVVAFWQPQTLPSKGQSYDFNYRMTFTSNEPRLYSNQLAWVDSTRRSEGEVKQGDTSRKSDGTVAYIVDFRGDNLKSLNAQSVVTADVLPSDNVEVVSADVARQPVIDGYRLTLKLRVKDASKSQDVRAFIKDGTGHRLSETWRLLKTSDA